MDNQTAKQTYEQASALFKQGQYVDAFELLNRLATLFPENQQVLQAHAQCKAALQQQGGAAVKTSKQSSVKKPRSPKIFLLVGGVMVGLVVLLVLARLSRIGEDIRLHYAFEGDMAEHVLDLSNNGNQGILHGVKRESNGVLGSCLVFNGEDSYVDCGTGPSLDFGERGFTVAFWIKAGIQDATLISKVRGEATPPRTGWNIQCENTEVRMWGIKLCMSDGSHGGEDIVNVGPEALDNSWHHIAFLIDQDEHSATAYLDGARVNSTSIDEVGSVDNDRQLLLGWRGDWVPFNGQLDDLRIYAGVVSPGALKRLHEMRVDVATSTEPAPAPSAAPASSQSQKRPPRWDAARSTSPRRESRLSNHARRVGVPPP